LSYGSSALHFSSLRSIYLWSFIFMHSFKSYAQKVKSFKNENKQRAITPKEWCPELWFLCTALFLNEIYLAMKFQVSSLNTYWVMLRTKFKNENEQRVITSNVWCLELWFLCTALLLNGIYLPMKFHVDALHSFKVMLRTKKERTDGLTIAYGVLFPSGLVTWQKSIIWYLNMSFYQLAIC